MKKITKSVIALLAIAAVMPACKKGENDPFLSLRSRKGRVAGEWTVASMEQTGTSSNTNTSGTNTSTSSNTFTSNFDGATFTENGSSTYTSGSTSTTTTDPTGTGTGSIKYTFEKDGTMKMDWTSVISTTETDIDDYSSSGYVYKITTKTTETTDTKRSWTGNWNFLGGVGKEVKNKEGMVIYYTGGTTTTITTTKEDVTTEQGATGSVTTTTDSETSTVTSSSTDTDSATDPNETWTITQLKNSEMLVEGMYKNSSSGTSTSSYTSGGTTFSSTGTSTSSSDGTVKMTLTQE